MYNYLEAMKDDIKEVLEYDYNLDDFSDRDELEETLNDDLWTNDGVTGNASGSYTFNRNQSKEYIFDNTDLLQEACKEFGCIDELGKRFCDEDFEWMDVTIRCYLLGQAIGETLDELENAGELVFAEV